LNQQRVRRCIHHNGFAVDLELNLHSCLLLTGFH